MSHVCRQDVGIDNVQKMRLGKGAPQQAKRTLCTSHHGYAVRVIDGYAFEYPAVTPVGIGGARTDLQLLTNGTPVKDPWSRRAWPRR